ncbi:MAG TPA: anthranilate phosphoribosyltransferase [Acidimicrobiales bacterium]
MTTIADHGGWPAVLGRLVNRADLSVEVARAAMAEILEGAASPAQMAAFVVALRMKGETVDELTGLLDAMLGAAELVDIGDDERAGLVDIVGTGGDRSHTINVSTLASLVVAGSGATVCKHGNRAASSSCGSADLLETLGVALDLTPAGIVHCLRTAGMAFCFAPRFHPALRHAGPPRREMGIPTAFNIMGPMANPARVLRQVVGVADQSVAAKMLGVLRNHGAVHVMVVHGDDGLDELTTTGTSTVYELRDGEITSYRVDPDSVGLARVEAGALQGGSPSVNAELARRVLAGESGPHRDIVLLNAAAGLVVAGVAPTLADGVATAGAVIDDGRAAAALERLVAASREVATT